MKPHTHTNMKAWMLIGLMLFAFDSPIFSQQRSSPQQAAGASQKGDTSQKAGASQKPGGKPSGRSFQMPTGRFYGKVVDESGKAVSYASVQLVGMKFNPATKKKEESVIAGQLTAENGDFSLEKVPLRGEFTLKISVLGFANLEQKVSLSTPGDKSGGGGQGGGQWSGGRSSGRSWGGGMAGGLEKDLGNIKLAEEALTLDEVVIEGEGTQMTLALDKKVFRVDKNINSLGGTAEDALRNVPSLNIDIDGNLTLRNAAPQLFVDGRPTTLTLDQIPADAIESVEVITNPSAKYDASGGQAGIVNIVMKKDRRIGYNGSLRIGVDTQGGYNGGGNINLREGKINVFLSAFTNQRVSQSVGETYRQNLLGDPRTNILQETESEFVGNFTNIRGGIDFLMDNRNTLTVSGSMTRGKFTPESIIDITTDSLFGPRTSSSEAIRYSNSDRMFRNIGGSILFKHLFPKSGKEWTADVNINRVIFEGNGEFTTDYITNGFNTRERQISDGGSNFMTVQTDYVDPLTKNIKIETGLRAALRRNENNNASSLFNPIEGDWKRAANFADQYEFEDAVYAAYMTFSHQFKRWGYQLGLRAESSQYTGILPENGEVFENDYPLSLFPSAFATYKLNEKDNIQFSYSRRINRPNFFQLMPFTDFSDSLNLRRGNPNLLPEFTNSFEVTYLNILPKGNDILVSAYYKSASDLITNYQFTEVIGGKEVLVTGVSNSNYSEAYGLEFTMRNTITKNIELTSNVNLYNSKVDASNVEDGLINEQFTWFAKENLVIKLPANFRVQITGEYRSRTAFSPSSGGGRFRGWRGVSNTAQGYTIPNWFLDVAVRKDLFKRKVSLAVSMNDVFRSRKTGSYAESMFFIQDSWRLRNPQVVRVNLSYRFGKPDVSLFKRKNNRVNTQGSDMM